jgi:hypothetical protein
VKLAVVAVVAVIHEERGDSCMALQLPVSEVSEVSGSPL